MRTLALSKVTTATTYSFRALDGFGWALCTVNDETGELAIQSDWGSWTYRWNPSPAALGAPTLTHFIADRSSVDYLARKLQNKGNGARRFSPTKTAAALRRRLVERRLEDGRDQIDNAYCFDAVPPWLARQYDERGLPYRSHRMPAGYTAGRPFDIHGNPYEPLPYLTKEKARAIWNELGELAAELESARSAGDLFWERVLRIDGFDEYVSDYPFELAETEQTIEDQILRETILPALIEACRVVVSPPAQEVARG